MFEAWAASQTLTVTGHATAQTNYPVKVDVTWASGMKSNFDDLRFSDAAGTTALKFWRESTYVSGTSARFWVVIPSLPASGSSTTIKQFWGNSAASYAGEPYGANGVFLTYDGGNAPAPTRPATPYMTPPGLGAAWYDSYFFFLDWVRYFDGRIYRDGSGYAYGVFNGSNQARRATIDGTPPYDGNDGPGDDTPGLVRTLDFNSLEVVSTSGPIICWGSNNYPSSWDPTSGTTWDGRVLQSSRIFYDDAGITNGGTPQFVQFFDGDAGPARVIEAYRQGVATCPTLTGTWTKRETGNPSGQKWTFAHSYLNDNIHDDSVAYMGGIVYDPDDPNPNKRWKNFYTGQCYGRGWGIMSASAPNWYGPWTRTQSTWLLKPRPSDGSYDGILENVWMLRGILYMTYLSLGVDTDGAGRRVWSVNLLVSSDRGATWTDRGMIFRQSTDPSAWDYARVLDSGTIWDPVSGKWTLTYTGSAVGNGAYGDVTTYVPPLSIGVAKWDAVPAFLSSEPTVSAAYVAPLTIVGATGWSQAGAALTVVAGGGSTDTQADVYSASGGALRFSGAHASRFRASLDGTSWATSVTLPAGGSSIYLRVTPQVGDTVLSASVGVPN